MRRHSLTPGLHTTQKAAGIKNSFRIKLAFDLAHERKAGRRRTPDINPLFPSRRSGEYDGVAAALARERDQFWKLFDGGLIRCRRDPDCSYRSITEDRGIEICGFPVGKCLHDLRDGRSGHGCAIDEALRRKRKIADLIPVSLMTFVAEPFVF